MSEETPDAKGLFNNEVRIKGTVISFEKLVSKAGKDWAKLTLEHIRKYQDEQTPECYDIVIFGKAMDGQAAHIKEHDQIEVVCRVQSREYKDRWYIELLLKDVKFLQIGERDKAPKTESGTSEVPAQPVEQDAALPF